MRGRDPHAVEHRELPPPRQPIAIPSLNVTPTEPTCEHMGAGSAIDPFDPPRSEHGARIFSDELGGFSKLKAGSVMIEFLWLGMFFSIIDSATAEARS
jgi:hypothetical protein